MNTHTQGKEKEMRLHNTHCYNCSPWVTFLGVLWLHASMLSRVFLVNANARNCTLLCLETGSHWSAQCSEHIKQCTGSRVLRAWASWPQLAHKPETYLSQNHMRWGQDCCNELASFFYDQHKNRAIGCNFLQTAWCSDYCQRGADNERLCRSMWCHEWRKWKKKKFLRASPTYCAIA